MPIGQIVPGMTHFIVLQTNHPVSSNNIVEFVNTDPLVFQNAGMDCAFDLTVDPYNPLNHNLSFASNDFEFNATSEGSYIRSGESADVDLTVDHGELWHRNNMIVLGNYSPPTYNLSFELGADDVTIIHGFGGVIEPISYDLNFQNDNPVAPTNYDLNFAPAQDIIIKSFTYDFYAMFNGIAVDVELTIDRNVLDNDQDVCGAPTGFTVLEGIYHRELLPVDSRQFDFSERPVDNYLNFRFDVMTGNCAFDMFFNAIGNDVDVITDLLLADRPIAINRHNSTNFDLTECPPGSNFDLKNIIQGDTVPGKNLKYDVSRCSADSNPLLNIDNHNFQFSADFLDKDCDEIIIDFYHGGVGSALIAKDVEINDVEPEHGHHSELNLSITTHLSVDADHGSYTVVNLLSTFPAAIMDGDAYQGSAVGFDLLTTSIFRDVDSYNGTTANFELETLLAPEFEPHAYSGDTNEFNLLTEPIITIENVSHGTYLDMDFTSFPSIEIDADAYSGSTMDTVILSFALFDADSYHGDYSDLDLTTFEPKGFGDIDGYYGADSIGDLAYSPTLDMDSHHGSDADGGLSSTTTLDAESHYGSYGGVDLTPVSAPELDPIAYHGGDGVSSVVVTKALFPRAHHGVAADADLEDHPAIELDIGGYNGILAEVDELNEADFNTFAYHGATIDDLNLQVTVNFPTEDIYSGESAEGEVSREASLDADAYHGAGGVLSNFEVPVGATILANAYGGEALTPNLYAPVHAQLTFHPIVASQTLYDGLGGVGGINHCYISGGSNMIRLGFDPLNINDRLNISFDDIGDDPWTTCNGGGMHFEWDIRTNARLEAHAYAGEYVHMYIPLEVTPLFGADVPLDRLYEFEYFAVIVREVFELEEIKYETTGAVWDYPEDFVAFYEAYFSADVTLTAFASMFHGAYANADFVVPVFGWKTAQQPFGTGEYVCIEFEPVDYTRFCKGYIVPNGNAVVFEFDSVEDYDCSIFLVENGAQTHDISLQVFPNMIPEPAQEGLHARASLTVQELWTLYAHIGNRAQVAGRAEFEGSIPYGMHAECTFYEPPIDGYTGEHVAFDDLIVPGPGIRWVTETQCLPNEYIPVTEDGDLDLKALEPDENGVVHVPNVPVEQLPYLAYLLAECITFLESQDDE